MSQQDNVQEGPSRSTYGTTASWTGLRLFTCVQLFFILYFAFIVNIIEPKPDCSLIPNSEKTEHPEKIPTF